MCDTHRHSGSTKNQAMPSPPPETYEDSGGGTAVAELEPPEDSKEDFRAQGKAEHEDPGVVEAEVIEPPKHSEAPVVERSQRPADRHSGSTTNASMPSGHREKEQSAERPKLTEKPAAQTGSQEKSRARETAKPKEKDTQARPQAQKPREKAAPAAAAQTQTSQPQASPGSRKRKGRGRKKNKNRQQPQAAASSSGRQEESVSRPAHDKAVRVMALLDSASAEEGRYQGKAKKNAKKTWEVRVLIDLNEALTGETLRPSQVKGSAKTELLRKVELGIRNHLKEWTSQQKFPKFMKM